MNSHPYLRAYMAGIVIPTIFLLIATTCFFFARYVFNEPIAIERAMVFPMAVVPNLWGAWNMLYVAISRRWPISIHGAILPALLIPAGIALARSFDLTFVTVDRMAVFAPLAFVVYYLIWKYLVGRLNDLLGIGG